jgi:threonyl-tRNA synthetase
MKNSASYFLGDANNDSLQRIYGISFPDKKQLADYKTFLAEAAKRDHRKIGKVISSNSFNPKAAILMYHGATGARAFLLQRFKSRKLLLPSPWHTYLQYIDRVDAGAY